MMTQLARAGTGTVHPLDDVPLDVETISATTDAALCHQMSTTTRQQIDDLLPRLVDHLNGLLAGELGADEDDCVRAEFREAYKLLDMQNRPTASTPTFGAFIYMRDVASLTRRFLWLYARRSGLDAPYAPEHSSLFTSWCFPP
ncbi:hypothetical protein OIB37_14815 [Streptomyces sp. NBC_00820]|uniref:hypothetical protein n=1 Tax=Streptomyces sp. NBC_00820 TaxID=2975842 RepID=UPI002ED0FEE1|nr:hypothetical protein OIB37_14815 [Streptomyces sp. NBC_00820]